MSFHSVGNRGQRPKVRKMHEIQSIQEEPGATFSRIFQLKPAQNQSNSPREGIQRPFNTTIGKMNKIYRKKMRLTFPLWCSRSGRGQGAFLHISHRLNSKTSENNSCITSARVDWGKTHRQITYFSRGLATPSEKCAKNHKIFISVQSCTA